MSSKIQNTKSKKLVLQEAFDAPSSCEIPAPTTINSCYWETPISGTVKVNVDGSFIRENGQASIGIIARNDKWEILFLAARMLARFNSAEEAELQAINEGLDLTSVWIKD